MKGSTRKRGSSWSYYFNIGKIDGKPKKKEKGGFRTKAEAEAALRQAIKEFEACGEVFEATELSVKDYFNYWFKNYVQINCKLGTQRYYRQILDNHIFPYFDEYKLKQLKPATLQKFLNYKMMNGMSKSSVSNFYGVLSGALKYAVYPCNYLKENPMTYVSMPKYDEKVKEATDLKIITLEEFDRIIARFPKGSSLYIPLQIAFHTGMRGGEVAALLWENVDLEAKTITVKYTLNEVPGPTGPSFELGTPKTKSSYRTITIGQTLIDILLEHKAWQEDNRTKYGKWYKDSAFVCTKKNGDPVTTNTYKYMNRVVNYELQIKFSMHSLRHTHATLLLEGGANIKDIQKRLGHSKLATTMDTYSHVTDKMKNNTVDIFESIATRVGQE
ncbi:tyrosine-type recombinase/integrase [Clostridium perfringens]